VDKIFFECSPAGGSKVRRMRLRYLEDEKMKTGRQKAKVRRSYI
jgi:hypothetical protein